MSCPGAQWWDASEGSFLFPGVGITKEVYPALTVFFIERGFPPKSRSILKVFPPETSLNSFPGTVTAECPELVSPMPTCRKSRKTKVLI